MKEQVKFEDLYLRNHFHSGSTIYSKAYYHYTPVTIDHIHGFYEINVVVEGFGEEIINNDTIQAKRGDVFIMETNTKHRITNKENMKVFHILLNNFFFETINDNHKYILQALKYQKTEKEKSSYFYFHVDEPDFTKIVNYCNLLLEAQKDCFKYKELTETICTDLICVIIAEVIKHNEEVTKNISSFDSNDFNKHSNEILLIKTLNYIHENYADKITIDDLLQISLLSKPSFEKCFKNYTGMTPTQYIYLTRTKKAHELIMSGKTDIILIANDCGFFDSSHLYKHFKQVYKMTPKQLINSLNKDKQKDK